MPRIRKQQFVGILRVWWKIICMKNEIVYNLIDVGVISVFFFLFVIIATKHIK